MEGFKKLPKTVQCFKEGGAVYKSRHSEKSEMSEDVAQDKKIIKKAFAMHDKQEHKGEKTDLSKLRKGGRLKKCGGGNVRKYKAGGEVTNVYEAKKASGDLDNIKKVKNIKPTKAAAPSKATVIPKNTPAAFKKGSKVKKYSGADESYVTSPAPGPTNPAAMQDQLDTEANEATRNLVLGPARAIGDTLKGVTSFEQAKKKKMRDLATKYGANAGAQMTGNEVQKLTTPNPVMPGQKRGGKVCK